jgi:HdeA/HdeB family
VKPLVAMALMVCLGAARSHADSLNLATLTCAKYENEVLPNAVANPVADSVNTVMWLFGYSVAQARAHVMYPDALAPFGFALDAECKANPPEILLAALAIVKPQSQSSMDLRAVECSAFAGKHIPLSKTDPESATTIMMWLFGFSVATSGSTLFEAAALPAFENSLLAHCTKHPKRSVFDALVAVNGAKSSRATRANPRDQT